MKLREGYTYLELGLGIEGVLEVFVDIYCFSNGGDGAILVTRLF